MSIIGIIPAKGGSKGIKNKNLVSFCGKPLIYWTIRQALESRIEKLYVSTDDEEIAERALEYGAEIAVRPVRLAQDGSSSEEAILYTIDMNNIVDDDLIVFLQCTSPLRIADDINQCIELLDYSLMVPRMQIRIKKADSLFSASILKDSTVWEFDGELKGALFDPLDRSIMRQDRKKYYYENGSIYCFYAGGIRKTKNRLHGEIRAYLMPFWKSFEIDEYDDIELCEYYFKKYLL